jgi:outer membrane lipoprotein carrier protein
VAADPAAKGKPAGPAATPAVKPAAAATPAAKPAAAATPAAKPAAATPPQAPAGKPAAATGAAAGASGPATPAAPATAAADRPALPRVVDNIQKVYERTANLKARFAQTLQSAMGKRQASGILRLKKPGKMRWDYEKPEKKLFVTDGAMLWMYEPEDEQAFRQPLNSSQLPAQVSFLFGKGRLSDEFDITYLDGQKLGQPGDLVLKLVPKKATAQYKHLVFVVDPASFMVKETVLYDQQGGTNHIVFSAIETNLKADIDDSRFTFTPPPNTKIINPR